MRTAGYGAYRQVQAETSSTGELLLLLYDALEQRLAQADAALAEGQREAAHQPLIRCQEIVLELIASLDLEQGELPAQLSALYEYCYQRLLAASLDQDVTMVRDVARVIAPLGEAWRHAVLAEREGAPRG